MKKQFLHEHHNRQDKVFAPDYRREMWAASTFSGITPQEKARARLALLKSVRRWFFCYSGWVYSPGIGIKQFANFNNADPNDLNAKAALEQAKSAFPTDLALVETAIKEGQAKSIRGIMGKLLGPHRLYFEWNIPEIAQVEYISQKLPKKYIEAAVKKRQKQKGTAPLPEVDPFRRG